jgi:hypothetical protein
VLDHVSAEPLVQALVPALAGQVEVELAERGRERIRVPQREDVAVGVVDLELVVERDLRAGHDALEDTARVHLLQRHVLVARVHLHGPRGRSQRAHHDAAVVLVGAQHRVRIAVLALDDPVQVEGSRDHSASRSRMMLATGMPTQSGRLLIS